MLVYLTIYEIRTVVQSGASLHYASKSGIPLPRYQPMKLHPK